VGPCAPLSSVAEHIHRARIATVGHDATSGLGAQRHARSQRRRVATLLCQAQHRCVVTLRQTGMSLIQEIVDIYRNYPFKTEVLVASTRHPIHIIEAAKMGADICTCPSKVIDQLFKHPLTDIGLANFLKDWEKSQAARV
jgi:transaldolase